MGIFNFGKKKKAKRELKRPEWDFYSYFYADGQVSVAEFDVEHALEDTHEGLANGFRMIIFIEPEKCLGSGIPNAKEDKSLRHVEHELIHSLAIHCRLVGILSYGAMRELIFQAEKAKEFETDINLWISMQKGYRMELKSYEGWSFFDEKLRPNVSMWQQISDRKAIAELIKAGSDVASEHVLEHNFIGPDIQLDKLKAQLLQDNFTLVSQSEGNLVLSKPSLLDLGAVNAITGRLASFCPRMGLEYDGWGTSVVNK